MSGTTYMVNGIRTITVEGSQYFCVKDVADILETLPYPVRQLIPEDRRMRVKLDARNAGGSYPREYWVMDSEGLESVIAHETEGLEDGDRRMWLRCWLDDTLERARTSIYAKPLPVELDPTGYDGQRAGLRHATDDGAIARDVASSMGLALDGLEDCVTYLDGFRSGALIASGDVSGLAGIQSLFCDLRDVENAMQRIDSRLEDIANGGDDDE